MALNIDGAALARLLATLASDDVNDIAATQPGNTGGTDEELALALAAQEYSDLVLAWSLETGLDGMLLRVALDEEINNARRRAAIDIGLQEHLVLPQVEGLRLLESPLPSPANSTSSTRRNSVSASSIRHDLTSPAADEVFADSTSPSASTPNTPILEPAGPSLPSVHTDNTTTQCSACLNAPPDEELYVAACGHKYDLECLADFFMSCLADPTMFPPRCCRELLDIDAARPLLPPALMQDFDSSVLQLLASNRLYCTSPACSEHIGSISAEPVSVSCTACGTRVCSACAAAHEMDVTCVQHADAAPLADLVRAEGLQRCAGCRRMVERISGCNHMHCVCRSEFCYRCGKPWPCTTCT